MNVETRTGRTASDPADIERRRRAYQKLRKRLGMSATEIAVLTGLSIKTIKTYPGTRPNVAPTWQTIECMRAEAIRRAKAAVLLAEDRLFQREIELQNLEREAA